MFRMLSSDDHSIKKFIETYINWRKIELANTYLVDEHASKSVEASGLLLSQKEFERLQVLCCFEDLLALKSSTSQLKEMIGESVLPLHPSFLLHLILKGELSKEETLACIDRFF